MKSQVIVDTGPLVALLNSSDKHHTWVVQQLGDIQPPMVTCEAVLAEATYLTRTVPVARIALVEMLGESFLNIGMAVADHHSSLLTMVRPTTMYLCRWPMLAWCDWRSFIRKARC